LVLFIIVRQGKCPKKQVSPKISLTHEKLLTSPFENLKVTVSALLRAAACGLLLREIGAEAVWGGCVGVSVCVEYVNFIPY